MKRIFKSMRANNQGFSLIEMIVTLLISGMVFATATLLLTTGLKQYEKVNTETVLQEESQIAQFYITELFQEAMAYNVVAEDDLPEGVSFAVEFQKESGWSVLALIGTELRYGSVEADSQAERVAELQAKNKKYTFLAKSVADVTLMEDSTYGYIFIRYDFAMLDKGYTSSSIVKLRNGKIN